MSVGVLTVSYGSSSVEFSEFSDTQLPSSYMAQASLEFSQIGAAYASGPARKQRKMWSVSSYVSRSKWASLEALYEEWDSKRAEGDNLAYVNITDELLGNPKTYNAFFTEPPSLSKLAPSNNTIFLATFVLVEI
jgi:hypothetical protein